MSQLEEILKNSERTAKIQKLIEKKNMLNRSVISVAIPLPPPSQQMLSLHNIEMPIKISYCDQVNENNNNNNVEYLKKSLCTQSTQSLNSDHHIEEDVLSLQVLSARSSTPHTQPMSFTSASCDLENVSEHAVSPVKEDGSNSSISKQRDSRFAKKTSNSTSRSANIPPLSCIKKPGGNSNYETANSMCDVDDRYMDVISYSKANLLLIRNEMCNSKFNYHHPGAISSATSIVNCNVIELEARLKKLNIWKMLDSDTSSATTTTYSSRNNSNSNTNSNNAHSYTMKSRNDLMPAFFKRKVTDESIIRSQPPQQPGEFKVSSYFVLSEVFPSYFVKQKNQNRNLPIKSLILCFHCTRFRVEESADAH